MPHKAPFQIPEDLDEKSPSFPWISIVISVLIHIVLFTSVPSRIFQSGVDSQQSSPRIIKVKRIPKQDGRLVDVQDQRGVTDEDVETEFLSDRNRKVEKQTRALDLRRENNTNTGAGQNVGPGTEKKSKYSLQLSDREIRDLAMQSGPAPSIKSFSSNYLPEISIGNETLLNTKEFAYHSFYLRMKREIEGFWNPVRAIAANPTIHGTFITTINVVLDEQGDVLNLSVLRSSGMSELDREATSAIERASPFPNPPKELLGEDSRIRVNWSFIFDRTSLM